MKPFPLLRRHALIWSLGICLAFLSTGCTSVKVIRTIGLPGLSPLPNGSQIEVVEEGKPVSQSYQIVGKVTVALFKGQQPPDKNFSYKKMKELAASMGANGLIGIHEEVGVDSRGLVGLRSGLAVKWLAPSETKRPLTKPFVVAVMPLAMDAPVTNQLVARPMGKQAAAAPVGRKVDAQLELTTAVTKAARVPLELRGYYVLPPETVTYQGGLVGARELSDADLQNLGGDDAQLLLDVTVQSRAQATIIISSSAAVKVQATLMNKATRANVFQGTGTGTMSAGWLVNMLMNKQNLATGIASVVALDSLTSIGEELPK